MAYTNIDDPSAYFQIAIYSGSNSLQAITNDGNSDLKPDWLWIKQRSSTEDHMLVDSTRGVTKYLRSNSTGAEQTVTSRVETLDTDGFTVNGSSNPVNALGGTYVAWQWKANGGTTSTNTDGSVNTTVQTNTDAGFSIVGYTCPNPITNFTIGHGLGVTPDVIIVKTRDGSRNWGVYHKSLTAPAENRNLKLNLANAEAAESSFWANTAPTSSVITIAQNASVNYQGHNYVAYCFAEKQGFSKFGKYVSNGNADGPFVYTGFKPAFVIIKSADTAKPWVMKTAAISENPINEILYPNLTNAEGSDGLIDFVSNGFKVREGPDANINNSLSDKYIYMAFAENPFTTSTGIPTTAR
jgi:hypothetical protein